MSPSPPFLELPGWNLGHLCKKVRASKGWSIHQCAVASGLRDLDVLAVEDNQPATAELHIHRLSGLERAFGINMIAAVHSIPHLNDPDRPSSRDTDRRRPTRLLPFVTPQRSIHQLSMEWSRDGVMVDAFEHAPHLSVISPNLLMQFRGRQIPQRFYKGVYPDTHWSTPRIRQQVIAAVRAPHQLFAHFKRLIAGAIRQDWTPPLRYEAKLANGGAKVTREVTCVRLSANAYETQTHVISEEKRLQRAFVDVKCCGRFRDCTQCFDEAFRRIFEQTG